MPEEQLILRHFQFPIHGRSLVASKSGLRLASCHAFGPSIFQDLPRTLQAHGRGCNTGFEGGVDRSFGLCLEHTAWCVMTFHHGLTTRFFQRVQPFLGGDGRGGLAEAL